MIRITNFLNRYQLIGVYKSNKLLFGQPLIRYRFSLLQSYRGFVLICPAKKLKIDRVVREKSADLLQRACDNACFFQKLSLGTSDLVFAFQGRAACGCFKIAAEIGFLPSPLHDQMITVIVSHQDLAHKMIQPLRYRLTSDQIDIRKGAIF